MLTHIGTVQFSIYPKMPSSKSIERFGEMKSMGKWGKFDYILCNIVAFNVIFFFFFVSVSRNLSMHMCVCMWSYSA